MTVAPAAPVPLSLHHDCSDFNCGNDELSNWLRQHAHDNDVARGSRCFVACDKNRVAAYYALAAGSVERANTRGSVRRNMPDPIPAIVLGRLAVDGKWQNQGLGADLLKDAIVRALRAANEIGARVMLCHAIDEKARQFYLHHNFVESTFDRLTIMLDLRKAEDMLLS